MDDILESVHFEEFFKALKTSMKRSAAMKKAWEHPSAKRELAPVLWGIAGSAALAKWREERPEESADNYRKAAERLAKWKEEHPEATLLNLLNARSLAAEWREENPEEVAANLKRSTLAGLAAIAKWQEEHPEEHAVQLERWQAGGGKWQEEHPEEHAVQLERWRAAGAKWREEHPVEMAAYKEKWKAAPAKWREEKPEEHAAARRKAAESLAKTYPEIFRSIKPLMTNTGLRIRDMLKLCPQWTRNQLKWFLRRAIKRGDLIAVGTRCAMRYHLPEWISTFSNSDVIADRVRMTN
jgi:hypothetical protein